jgi:hypothetical protein
MVQRSIDDAQNIAGLDETQKVVITKTKTDLASVQAPSSASSDAGNADYWLVLVDSGRIELHAGTPLADGGALFTSKLLASKGSAVREK